MENIMHDKADISDTLLNAEIKALLILLLLKGGTPSSEIRTALRLATGEVGKPGNGEISRPPASAPKRPVPRQRIDNSPLPPLKSYAA
jgi:hypothetical protein